MAVDPLTAKILAKVAVQAATDSESRKRILFMILAPVLGLLLLIAFILYLINCGLTASASKNCKGVISK